MDVEPHSDQEKQEKDKDIVVSYDEALAEVGNQRI